ncbi:hypothetical protein ACFYWS_11605 [Streptomyces sp. NPDC002795]|uniref:hypothetical protein n=1 Tax=Streptomyces sp. NPDC002795 TaxID=3364665 RepID=UPI00367FF60C
MLALLFILLAGPFGLGVLNPLWWAAAAALIFGLLHYRRGGRDHRDRQDRWDHAHHG